jgi:hypothetical protein
MDASSTAMPSFSSKPLRKLRIQDAASFETVTLYHALHDVLCDAKYTFRILPKQDAGRWDLSVALNLTFWSADAGGDILVDGSIAPDVIAHVAWHHLASKAFTALGRGHCADALILGEAIASAFDIYLVGKLIRMAPGAEFLKTQITAMSETASAAGMPERMFETMLMQISENPERAFEDLRSLLFDVTTSLLGCSTASEALEVFHTHRKHRFAALLHRYELSNWVLYTRAYAIGKREYRPDLKLRRFDQALRNANSSLDFLREQWLSAHLPKRPRLTE